MSRTWASRSRPFAAALLLGMLLGSSSLLAYERATVDDNPDLYLYWPRRDISYLINRRGCADVPTAEAVGAIKRAFFTWASPSCTDVYFNLEEMTDEERTNLAKFGATKADRKNIIVWRDDAWPPLGVPPGDAPAEVAALTTLSYDASTGEIVDADIDLNGFDFFWSATDDKTAAATDIQNVLTHEVGHLLGLDDLTSVASKEATMYGLQEQAEFKKRDLSPDDLQAICTIYPYGRLTPVGPKQPPPHTGVQGATSGCQLRGAGARTSDQPLALALALVLGYMMARVRVLRPLLRSGHRARRPRESPPPGALRS